MATITPGDLRSTENPLIALSVIRPVATAACAGTRSTAPVDIASTTSFGLNSSLDYEKLVFTDVSGAVPEPSSWALMIVAFTTVGVGARQWRRVVAALARSSQ